MNGTFLILGSGFHFLWVHSFPFWVSHISIVRFTFSFPKSGRNHCGFATSPSAMRIACSNLSPRGCCFATNCPVQLRVARPCYRLESECSDLLRPAFWRGLSLYLPQVTAIRRALKLPELKKGHGSGARGTVVKRDIVKQILTHLFPHCSEQDFLRMLNFTAPENKPKASDDGTEKLSDSLQYLVSCLDIENCEEFKNIVHCQAGQRRDARESPSEGKRSCGSRLEKNTPLPIGGSQGKDCQA